jgi:hypothetical protein
VFKVAKENLKYIKSENIVSSSEEYFTRKNEESKKLMSKINDINTNNYFK